MIKKSSYYFVGVVYALLGMAFLASTASIFHEFGWETGSAIAIAHSHQFLFFPILGVAALIAFYLPSVVFADLYWQHIWLGVPRFIFGAVVAIVLSLVVTDQLHNSSLRGIWELSQATLDKDLSDPAAAARPHKPMMTVLKDVMSEAGQRSTISQFARNCAWDRKVERPLTDEALRLCVPSGAMQKTDDCCYIQRAFRDHVRSVWGDPTQRSKAAELDRYLLPFKIFFIIVLLAIGCFLAFWRKELGQHYSAMLPRVERGVIVGALCMLIWPLMDYGYQQTSDVMFGREYASVNIRHSLVMIPWAALLLLYFVDFGKNSTRTTQISTIVGGAVTLLRYQEINDLSARLLGAGATWAHFGFIGSVAFIGVIWLVRNRRGVGPGGKS